jgi:hypothetical protein
MAGVVTHLQQLKDGCWHALSSRIARWTKPLSSSLPLGTLADLGRSKSELIAENTLLRQQFILLKRQVKRPPVTRADRVLLVLLARLVRAWQQAQITRATRHPASLASGALSPLLEAQVKDSCSSAEGRPRNHRVDQADGAGQSPSSVLSAFAENS